MVGRPRIPTKQKIIRGTFRRDRAHPNEPEPEQLRTAPPAPTHLPEHGRRMWRELAGELSATGVLTVVDLPALEACCYQYGIYRDLDAEMRCWIIDDETGKRRRRTAAEYLSHGSGARLVYAQMTKTFALFRQYLQEFGLTPASRARLDLPEGDADPVDPMERLLNEG